MMRPLALAVLLAFSSVSEAAGGLSSQSEIRGFQLNTCVHGAKLCLEARSPLASGSFIRPIYAMESLEVKLVDANKRVIKQWKSASGWFDLEINQLVVVEEVNKKQKETVIDLNRLEYFE